MSKTWTAEPHQTVPEQLAETLRQLRQSKDRRFAPALAAARAREWGVPALAAAVGMTPDAVAQRIQRANRALAAGDMRGQDLAGIDIRVSPTSATKHPNSVRCGPALTASTVAHLRDLHAQHQLVRGNLPFSHPRRRASAHLAVDVDFLVRAKGVLLTEVVRALGVSHRAVHQLLERHGLKEPAPSYASRPGHVYRPNQADGHYVAVRRVR